LPRGPGGVLDTVVFKQHADRDRSEVWVQVPAASFVFVEVSDAT